MRMLKKLVAVIVILLFHQFVFSQTPQFAVVRPDGTTYMCTTWDSAYNKALDGDIIYLPGTTILSSGSITIDKQLTLIGAGHYPDSTLATSKTLFVNSIILKKRVSFEGFEVLTNINSGDSACSQSSFTRIKCSAFSFQNSGGHFINGCVFSTMSGVAGGCIYSRNNIIQNSICTNYLQGIILSEFRNCLFFYGSNPFNVEGVNFYNCLFRNGGFSLGSLGGGCSFGISCNSYNSVFSQPNLPFNSATSSGNFLNVTDANLFENLPNSGFSYYYNYHLKSGSSYLTAGTDGTQVGIYGGNFPYKEGAVPSNPHIYFKQIDPQTGSDGKLKVQVKVRTN